jgi:DNA-binding transcriptional MerR regulator
MEKRMTRQFSYVTVGRIIQELQDEGLKVSRVGFYRLEGRLPFPTTKKSSGGWRRYSRRHAETIKRLIKEDYGFEEDFQPNFTQN